MSTGKAGQKILDGLKDAIAGNFARVTIEGQEWTRTNWRPIETAPKDGTDVLLFSPDASEPQVFLGYWINEERGWFDTWKDDAPEIDADPTHWMPLPSPPMLAAAKAIAKAEGRP